MERPKPNYRTGLMILAGSLIFGPLGPVLAACAPKALNGAATPPALTPKTPDADPSSVPSVIAPTPETGTETVKFVSAEVLDEISIQGETTVNGKTGRVIEVGKSISAIYDQVKEGLVGTPIEPGDPSSRTISEADMSLMAIKVKTDNNNNPDYYFPFIAVRTAENDAAIYMVVVNDDPVTPQTEAYAVKLVPDETTSPNGQESRTLNLPVINGTTVTYVRIFTQENGGGTIWFTPYGGAEEDKSVKVNGLQKLFIPDVEPTEEVPPTQVPATPKEEPTPTPTTVIEASPTPLLEIRPSEVMAGDVTWYDSEGISTMGGHIELTNTKKLYQDVITAFAVGPMNREYMADLGISFVDNEDVMRERLWNYLSTHAWKLPGTSPSGIALKMPLDEGATYPKAGTTSLLKDGITLDGLYIFAANYHQFTTDPRVSSYLLRLGVKKGANLPDTLFNPSLNYRDVVYGFLIDDSQRPVIAILNLSDPSTAVSMANRIVLGGASGNDFRESQEDLVNAEIATWVRLLAAVRPGMVYTSCTFPYDVGPGSCWTDGNTEDLIIKPNDVLSPVISIKN